MSALGRGLYYFKYNQKRGWGAAWGEYVHGSKIHRWKIKKGESNSVSLHTVGGHEQLLMAKWMIASWLELSGLDSPIFFHDDGSLTSQDEEELQQLFPNLTVVWRESADEEMDRLLASFPKCREYRDRMPHGLKCFDVPFLNQEICEDKFLLVDPDVLFFKGPDFISEWCQNDSDDTVWFNGEPKEPSIYEDEKLRGLLPFAFWKGVNSGLCLLRREMLSLDFFEECFGREEFGKTKDWRVEQTLLALAGSRYGKGGILPRQYEISFGASRQKDAIARHYVGEVRSRLWAEGIPALSKRLTFH